MESLKAPPALDDKPFHITEPQAVSPVPQATSPPQPRLSVAPPPGFEHVIPTPPVPAVVAPAVVAKGQDVVEAEVGLSLEERLRIARAQSEKKARKDKKKKTKGKQGSVAVAAYRQAQQDEASKKPTAEPLVQFSSWKDQAISEEERAKRRFGQGTRNLSAIAVRKSQSDRAKGIGVIGGEATEPQQAAVKEMTTTAFSFGFSL